MGTTENGNFQILQIMVRENGQLHYPRPETLIDQPDSSASQPPAELPAIAARPMER